MNPSLKTIDARLAEIAKIKAELDAEEGELAIAKRVLQRLTGAMPDAPPRAPRGQAAVVTAILSDGPLWQPQKRIENMAVIEHDVVLKPTSLQPLLSKLKAQGVIVKGPEGYALAERLKEEASPTEVEEAL